MIRLRLLGTLDLRDPDGTELREVLAQPKRCALLAFLAAAAPLAYHRRDTLLALLWPNLDQAQARHALRQALHYLRRSLGSEALVGRGDEDVGLAEGTVWCDARAFALAAAEGRLVEALELYRGDLLPGFFVPDRVPEFEQWLEMERGRLRNLASRAAWSLAETEAQHGNAAAAGHWARRAQSLAPDDEGVLRRLVSLLDGLGDRKGALRAYEEFARRLADEFEVTPAAETQALLAAVRSREIAAAGAGAVPPAHVPPATPAAAPDSTAPAALGAASPPTAARPAWRRRWVIAFATLAGLGGLVAAQAILGNRHPVPSTLIIAVGAFEDAAGGDTSALARTIPALVATDLARIPDLAVVSRDRLYEVLGQLGVTEATPTALAEAARRAGATDLVEGSVYPAAGDSLRLDLRRVALGTGVVQAAYTVRGRDAFAIADSAAAVLADNLDLRTPAGIEEREERGGSLVARRFYEEGLRTYYLSDQRAAHRFFEAALHEDSGFAMAAYYAGLSELSFAFQDGLRDIRHAATLADRAPDRDRLLIKQRWADLLSAPARLALAETLAVRYPHEPDGELALGNALTWAGDFLGAVKHLRRAITMDSTSLRASSARCRACDAYQQMITAYELSDSLPAAVRTALEWASRRPASAGPWIELMYLYGRQGRLDQGLSALRRAASLEPASIDPLLGVADVAVAVDSLQLADRAIATRLRGADRGAQLDALWVLGISLRNQGRLREAADVARRFRELSGPADSTQVPELFEAQTLFELGRFGAAVALFDSLAGQAVRVEREAPSLAARQRVWFLTQVATSLAAAGDTSRLPRLADSLETLGRQSAYGRDQLLHHYVRGLLLEARGEKAAAAAELRKAVFSTSDGYTRTNYELARLYLAAHRPGDAIAILRPVLDGPIQASNFYLTRTEAHELLARAFDEAGLRDSAAAHYRRVATNWTRGDPVFRARAEAAASRLAALERTGR